MSTESESGTSAVSVSGDRYVEVQAGAEFIALRKALRSFVFPATAAFLAWYLLYVVLSAYARDFMGAQVVGNLNVAFVFGILQFVSTFGIAYAYSLYADRKIDPLAVKLRTELEDRPGDATPATSPHATPDAAPPAAPAADRAPEGGDR